MIHITLTVKGPSQMVRHFLLLFGGQAINDGHGERGQYRMANLIRPPVFYHLLVTDELAMAIDAVTEGRMGLSGDSLWKRYPDCQTIEACCKAYRADQNVWLTDAKAALLDNASYGALGLKDWCLQNWGSKSDFTETDSEHSEYIGLDELNCRWSINAWVSSMPREFCERVSRCFPEMSVELNSPFEETWFAPARVLG